MSKKDWKKHFVRMKQLANQNLGRAEKSEVLSEDLLELERRVDQIRLVCIDTTQKVTACQPTHRNASDPNKRRRKLPQSVLSNSLFGSAVMLGDENDSLGQTYRLCGKAQNCLADSLFKYSEKVEDSVINPLQTVVEHDIPAIMKLRKQLTKLTLDMDAAKTRYHSAVRQQLTSSNSTASLSQSTTAINKADVVRQEMEDAENRVELCKDQLITEMYSFFAREGELSGALLSLLEAQTEFHRSALQSLEQYLPQLRQHIEQSVPKSVFGCPLETHLRHVDSDVSTVLEHCICALLQHGLNEEGLFRVAASGTKVKKLRAAFDAGVADLDEYKRDIHCIAGVLKLYLRELPEPLMTYELYDEWMHLVDMSPSARQNSMWVVVDKLPKANFNNLRYLIKFLARLAECSEVNKMTAANLAIVIAPSLMWPPPVDDLITNTGTGLQTANARSSVIEQLISKAEWFFPGDVDFFAVCQREPSHHMSRRCMSTDDRTVSVTPATPTTFSDDAYTLLSLPTFRGARQSVFISKTPTTGGYLTRNDSWSSFGSLHSLPEPFLYANRTEMMGGSRPILEESMVNGDERVLTDGRDMARMVGHKPIVRKHSYGTCSDGGSSGGATDGRRSSRHLQNATNHAENLSDGITSDEKLSENEAEQTNTEIKLSADGKAANKGSSHAGNVVMNHILRAKTMTSKTLRRLNPKLNFASMSKTIGGGTAVAIEHSPGSSGGNRVERSGSIAERFRIFRQHSWDQQNSASSAGGESRLNRLSRVRERSPLADETPPVAGSQQHGIARASLPGNSLEPTRDHRDHSAKRVLFGTSAITDERHGADTNRSRLGVGAGHARAASCNDGVTQQQSHKLESPLLIRRPRSSDPSAVAVTIRTQPSAFRTNSTTASQNRDQNLHSSQQSDRPITSRPPRIATPESSSLSSESPTSIFSAPVTMTTSLNLDLSRSLASADGLPSPYSIGTQSVFELSQSDLPSKASHADDFMNRVFAGNDGASTDSLLKTESLTDGTLQSCPPSLDLSTYVIGEKFEELSPRRHGRYIPSTASSNPDCAASPAKTTTGPSCADKVVDIPPALSLSVDSGCINEVNDGTDDGKDLTEHCIKAKAREFGENCFEGDFWSESCSATKFPPLSARSSRASGTEQSILCKNPLTVLTDNGILSNSGHVTGNSDCTVSPSRTGLDVVIPAPLDGECCSPKAAIKKSK